ncbi:MAG: hypothetical protein H0T51_17840 [Pirellulales bacterium]|nr:hypothetical protein [Pirellulales bacterium]
MKRSLLTILTVAAISGWISRGERAASVAEASDWVRTADGWEVRQMVEPYEPSVPPPVHPAVIAGLQLGASLFFLVAFPARVRVLPVRVSDGAAQPRRRARMAASGAA